MCTSEAIHDTDPLPASFDSLRCSFTAAADILALLDKRKHIVIVVDFIRWSSSPGFVEDQAKFLQLLQGHTVALASGFVRDCSPLSREVKVGATLTALDLGSCFAPQPGLIPITSFLPSSADGLPLNSLVDLKELWCGSYTDLRHQPIWRDLCQIVPWTKLRRLRMHGPLIQQRLHDVGSQLKALGELCLHAWNPTTFHENCAYHRPSIFTDVNYPFFDLDVASMPRLRALYIHGICNHIPVQNIVAPGLKTLRLHKAHAEYSVDNAQSQRSSADVFKIARIAPHLQVLELDIGHIMNLWHPTAIPGVDVDMEQYRFLAALSSFKALRALRLFPPYRTQVVSQSGSRLDGGYSQPLLDTQAIRLFNYVRTCCPTLELLSITASDMQPINSTNFDPMNWEIRPWGDKTLMVTRQLRKNYELRQLWVGERRLTMETRGHQHYKLPMPEPEGWVLPRSSSLFM